jgi:hypothetical protein
MYRVARRTVVFFEAQDSLMVRFAVRAGAVAEYEWNGIFDSGMTRGGVDDRPVPNYVYRWTRREVEKLVRSLDPGRTPHLGFVTEWDFSYRRIARRLQRSIIGFLPPSALEAACQAGLAVANSLLSRQGNLFAAVIDKSRSSPQRWMKAQGGSLVFDPATVTAPAAIPTSEGGSTPGPQPVRGRHR